jgi:AcrR family transcriptional regulator
LEPLTPERRREMTRRHLLEAALLVFAEDGFHGATLDKIAKRAGFTKGAVYSNFASKDELFLALLDERIERQFALATEVLEVSPPEREEQLPRMRDLLQGAAFLSGEAWSRMHLEFTLYALRNPDARAKLAENAQRARALSRQMMERAQEVEGWEPHYPLGDIALLSHAIFEGMAMARLIEPELITDDTVQMILSFLYDSLGSLEGQKP